MTKMVGIFRGAYSVFNQIGQEFMYNPNPVIFFYDSFLRCKNMNNQGLLQKYWLLMEDKNINQPIQPSEQSLPLRLQQRKSSVKMTIHPELDKKSEIVSSLTRIHFSQGHTLSVSMKNTKSIDAQQYAKGRSIKQQSAKLFSRSELIRHKQVLVLYASGSSGANQNLIIQKGFLQSKIRQNQYLCDEKIMQTLEDNEQFLITPEQENGTRIFYHIQEFSKIDSSINMKIEDIKQISIKIYENYAKYDAFIVLCGFDVICSVSTMVSFMLQNLSKLIIFTGGFFPLSYMRNDTVNNLNQSFSIISLADRFNDVIIVCKNKGYRGNRSIKMVEGGFATVSSPNLQALVSVNIKIKFREFLYLPVSTEEFRIWTNISCRAGIIKFHILLNTEALEHELNNPAYDGFVIESYGASNIPQKEDIWDLFKKVAEEKGKIFINVGQSVKKQNSSIMKEDLQKYHVYFGGDMTTQAALCKLSYLLSKKYSRSQIKRLIYTNMRGQLTQMKTQDQFQIRNPSFIQLVQQSLHHYYPSNLHNEFMKKVENQLALSTQKSSEFQTIFKRVKSKEYSEQEFKSTMARLINQNNLLHKAVQASNSDLYNYFLLFPILLDKQDQNDCSPLLYAIHQKDKKAIQSLLRKGCKIICNQDDLFSSFISQLQQDNVSYFEMLYHVEFKETLRDVVNYEGRTTLHLAALFKAQKCLKFLLQKFKFNVKQKDKYGKTYLDYNSMQK